MSEENKEPKVSGGQARRRYSSEEKVAFLEEADRPGQSIAVVARRHGVSASVMFRWRQLREQGAMTGLKADEPLVPASEMKAARLKIRELQRLLGKKTEENEILQEAVHLAYEKKLISRLPSLIRGGGR